MLKIGLVGFGFVGKAVAHGFRNNVLYLIDPTLGTSISDLSGKNPDVIFICVPTPMSKDGTIDSSIVESVISQIKTDPSLADSFIVLKSTVTPDIVDRLQKTVSNFIYNPEFLREKTAEEDFVNPSMHVFGGSPDNTSVLSYIYRKYSSCKEAPEFHMTAKEASFVKYSINTFLASKVLFFNQMKQLMDLHSADYNTVIDAVGADPRIGLSHTMVPGHDGKPGFGGACFTKDTAALSKFADGTLSVLDEVISRNNEIRSMFELDEREKAQNVHYV
jgi:UDPglucose 6-dehydrogenase